MRTRLPLLLLAACLLSGAAAPARAAAKKGKAAGGYDEIPAQSWNLIATGFGTLFPLRNQEVEAAEPNRFYPGAVAFALGRIDADGHFLMLKCSSGGCGDKRDALEDRMIFSALLEVVRTKAPKDQLFDRRTWELTPLGEKYIKILRKRYPDLPQRLGRLVGASFTARP